MPEIGIIGLGLLGSAMSERLLTAGWTVRGFDVDVDRRSEHEARGGVVVDTALSVSSAVPVPFAVV